MSTKQWKAEYERLAEAVRFAIDYAGGRESEWGERAEECFRILETAVSRKPEQPQPAEDSREFLAGPKGVEVINEDPDEWPKYWTTFDPDGFAFVKQISTDDCQCVFKDGTHGPVVVFSSADARKRKQITEAEAMALIKKPEPQPQKTRVRLWARPDGGHIWFCPDKPTNGSWQEIHHDSEGFYVEGGQP